MTIQIQQYGGEFNEETGELVLHYRDTPDTMDWTQKAAIEVRIPAQFVTYTDLTVQPEQLPEAPPELPTPPGE